MENNYILLKVGTSGFKSTDLETALMYVEKVKQHVLNEYNKAAELVPTIIALPNFDSGETRITFINNDGFNQITV